MQASLRSITEMLGWSLLHFLWIGTVLAVVLWLLLLLLRKRSPQARYVVASVVLGFILAGFAASCWYFWKSPTVAAAPETSHHEPLPRAMVTLPQAAYPSPVAASTVPTETVPTAIQPALTAPAPLPVISFAEHLRPILHWCVGIWAAGVLVFTVRFLAAWRAVQKWRSSGTRPISADWQARFSKLCQRLQLTGTVQLLASTAVGVPLVIGWLKPVILMPVGLFTGLTTGQLEAVLTHELAHVRRHDYLVNLMQNIVETLFFFHPAVWWVSSQLRKEREHCCDDIAASLTCGAIDYARALATLEELRTTPALSLAATDGSLLQRIRRLIGLPIEHCRAWPLGVFGIILAIAIPVVTMAATKDNKDSTDLKEKGRLDSQETETKTLTTSQEPKAPARILWSGSQIQLPEAAKKLLPSGAFGGTLNNGCVLITHGFDRDTGWWLPTAGRNTIDTAPETYLLGGLLTLTHFMIELPASTEETRAIPTEFEVSLGTAANPSARLELVPKPVWEENSSEEHPAAHAVDWREATSWQAKDPAKPAIAIFALEQALKVTPFLFHSKSQQNSIFSLKVKGSLKGRLRVVPILQPSGNQEEYFQAVRKLEPAEYLCSDPKLEQIVPLRFANSPASPLVFKHDQNGRFLDVGKVLELNTKAGFTTVHFEPRSLQGEGYNQPRSYPTSPELIESLVKLQALGSTSQRENWDRVVMCANQFDHESFTDKKQNLRLLVERKQKAPEYSDAAVRQFMAEIYAIHAAPLLKLELVEQFRIWDDTHVLLGSAPSAEETKSLVFGPTAGSGLSAAIDMQPARESYKNGEILQRYLVFRNEANVPVIFRVPPLPEYRNWTANPWTSKIKLEPGNIVRLRIPDYQVNEDIHGPQLSESVSGPLRDQIEIRRNLDIKVNGLWYLPVAEQEEKISAGARPYQVSFADPTSNSVQSASGPGTYFIAPGIRLQYSRNAEDGDKGSIVNRATIEWVRATGQYDQNSREKLLVPLQRSLQLPNGVNTFRIAWVAGGSALWIITAETVSKIDFSATELKESSWKRAEFNTGSAPKDLLKEAGNVAPLESE